MVYTQWQLLRSKTDETVDDTDWAGTNATPTAGTTASFPRHDGQSGKPLTGVEVFVVGRDSAGALVNRSTMTVDLQLIEVATVYSATGQSSTIVLDSSAASTTAVPLNRPCYFEMNGGTFALRVTNDANEAVDSFDVYWKAVSR